ncbi:hypothetical protein Trydic_g15215 [Trypoxylus dichotomus]
MCCQIATIVKAVSCTRRKCETFEISFPDFDTIPVEIFCVRAETLKAEKASTSANFVRFPTTTERERTTRNAIQLTDVAQINKVKALSPVSSLRYKRDEQPGRI